MKYLPAKLRVFLSCAFVSACLGCATSERDAAKNLDTTTEVIQQASNLFAADPELGRLLIVVDGFKNSMRLKGQVATPAQKARAEKILWSVRGVKSVENDLQVGSTVRR
jgi:osmotically-inducible protein OsmY